MARRERTTGLPRARRRENVRAKRRIAGLTWDDRRQRWAILGAIGALLLVVVGWIAYREIDDRFLRPNSVILTVGDEEVTLGYFSDRLLGFAQTNQSTTIALAEQALLTKLREEALEIELAKDRGITISEEEITQEIAAGLSVPIGGIGSSFDTLYRQKLKTEKMSDSNYRRLTKAAVADKKLIASFRAELGDGTPTVTLRTVVSSTKDAADVIVKRIQAGDNMGTLAQTESTDLQSRGQDGIMQPEPPGLLPKNVQDAIKGKQQGAEVLGPIEVEGKFWVVRIEKIDPAGVLSDAQKGQLAQAKLDEALQAKRESLGARISQSLDSSDIKWAEKHAN